MSMTDKDLCRGLLGWRLHDDGWTWLTPDGCTHIVPDFAHDIEAVMKLARAACEKWDLHYSLVELWDRETGWQPRVRFWPNSGEDKPHWDGRANRHEEAAAIRAAVVKVCEARAAKEQSNGN